MSILCLGYQPATRGLSCVSQHVYIVAMMALCGASSLAAFAQPAGKVQQRFDGKQQRINSWIATGALTRCEAARDEGHWRADEAVRHRQRVRYDGQPLNAGQKAWDKRSLNPNLARVYDTQHNGVVSVQRS